MEKENLLKQYISGAEEHGQGTESGDHKKANLAYSHINDAYKKLKEKNPKLTDLIPLLSHSNSSVRSWAASHLLSINSEAALPVLEKISQEKGLTAFSAEMTIKQWKEGKLEFGEYII